MKEFNQYTMTGKSEEDNKVIMLCLKNDIELKVDEYGRVLNSGGQWIADCICEEAGEGIGC